MPVCEMAWNSITLINTFVFDFQYLENLLPADPSTSINVKNPFRTSQEYLKKNIETTPEHLFQFLLLCSIAHDKDHHNELLEFQLG